MLTPAAPGALQLKRPGLPCLAGGGIGWWFPERLEQVPRRIDQTIVEQSLLPQL